MPILEVERGVPVPAPRVVYRYPFAEMEIGDSFRVPVAAYKTVLNAKSRAQRKLGWQFLARTEGDYIRVWRVS